MCYAQPMPLLHREPDAIDRWFAMQRKAWWKRWRWLIIGFAVIAVLHTFSFSFSPNIYWMIASHPDFFSGGSVLWEAYIWSRYNLQESLIIPVVLVPLTFAGSLVFPSEVVAAIGFNNLLRRKRQQVRYSLWLMFAISYFLPVFCVVNFVLFKFNSVWSPGAFPFSLALICWLVIFLAIAEFVVFVSTRQLVNWIVGICVAGVIAVFVLFRMYLLDSVQGFLDSPIGIIDDNIIWFALKPIAIAALVSLVALVFLVRANKAPAEYLAEG